MTTSMSPPEEPVDLRTSITERIIAAPRGVVFAAIRDPDRLARWWGPAGFSNTFAEFDFKEGGYWRFTMHGPDGRNYPNEIVFVEIVPDERVLLEHFSGHHFLLEISLSDQRDKTLLKWRQTFDTIEHYRKIADFVAGANEQNIDKLVDEIM